MTRHEYVTIVLKKNIIFTDCTFNLGGCYAHPNYELCLPSIFSIKICILTSGVSSFVEHQNGYGNFNLPLVPMTTASLTRLTPILHEIWATRSPLYFKVMAANSSTPGRTHNTVRTHTKYIHLMYKAKSPKSDLSVQCIIYSSKRAYIMPSVLRTYEYVLSQTAPYPALFLSLRNHSTIQLSL